MTYSHISSYKYTLVVVVVVIVDGSPLQMKASAT
jgi:hypothetical protein